MVARWWGIIAGCSFLVTTGLWAVDSLQVLGAVPAFEHTAAGQIKDEATLYIASFALVRQHLWLPILQATFFVLTYLSLIPLMLALNAVTGARRVRVQLAGGFFAAAAASGVLQAVPYLAALGYWRSIGWENVPPEIAWLAGRQVGTFFQLGAAAGLISYLALAGGFAFLGAACRSEEQLPRWLAPVAWVGSACLLAIVVLGLVPTGTSYAQGIPGFLVGVVIFPLVLIVLGVHLGRGVRQPSA